MGDNILKFLKACAKVNLNKSEEDIIYNYTLNITDKVGELIERHRLSSLYMKHLIEMSITRNLDKELRQRYSHQLFVLQFQLEEYCEYLKKISEDNELEKIEYAVLKGFSFMKDLYMHNNILYRYFADVDILISNEYIKQMDNVLKGIGLVQGSMREGKIFLAERRDVINWKINSHQLHEYIKLSKYTRVSPIYRVEFDVNTSIFEGGKNIDPISCGEVLKHREKREIVEGLDMYCLDYTWGLIQLCYHFYKDTQYEIKKKLKLDYCLYKFCDIREYVLKFRNQIRWNEFIEIVNNLKVDEQIYYVLWLVSCFYEDIGLDSILKGLNSKKCECKNIEWERILL